MAFIMLFSTFSFAINEHYCGEELKDRSFFVKASKCDIEMNTLESQKECNFHKKKCCDDVIKVVEGLDELQASNNSITTNQQLVVALFLYSYHKIFKNIENTVRIFNIYPPPLIVKNIYKRDEVYLI